MRSLLQLKCVKTGPMPRDGLHFAPIQSAGEPLWYVRQGGPAGLFLGTVVRVSGGYQATRIMAGGARPAGGFHHRGAAAGRRPATIKRARANEIKWGGGPPATPCGEGPKRRHSTAAGTQ